MSSTIGLSMRKPSASSPSPTPLDNPVTGRGGDMSRLLATPALALLLAAPAPAQTSFPMVTHAPPVAVRRGTTADVTVEGQQSFAAATGWLADHPGLTSEV